MIDKTEGEHNKSIGLAAGAARFAGVSPKRRRLISGGIAAAPILASMEVRNALAVDCLTPSRNLSGNLSHTSDIGACTGLSAQCYSTQTTQWTGSGVNANDAFSTVYISGILGTKTLKQVVDLYASANATEQLGAYFVAAYLNFKKGKINIPSVHPNEGDMLKSIWNEFITTGGYRVNAAKSWNVTDIRMYLVNSGIVGTTNC